MYPMTYWPTFQNVPNDLLTYFSKCTSIDLLLNVPNELLTYFSRPNKKKKRYPYWNTPNSISIVFIHLRHLLYFFHYSRIERGISIDWGCHRNLYLYINIYKRERERERERDSLRMNNRYMCIEIHFSSRNSSGVLDRWKIDGKDATIHWLKFLVIRKHKNSCGVLPPASLLCWSEIHKKW
jgi:hypothetical protein